MAKGRGRLLGSGSKGKANMQKANKGTGLPGGISGQPWVDPLKAAAATRAGQAGRMLHSAKSKSKSIGLGKSIGGGRGKRR